MGNRLLIFTRYPTVGKVKTRLIPILGAEGAARLHREMTERTVTIARALCHHSPVGVSVWVAGDSLALMPQWLGEDLDYHLQVGDNLGQRMASAFHASFQDGDDRVVIIGTDCPELTPEVPMAAFQHLHHHDIVLGPATDGGYYLIGLRRAVPELFTGIHWGTSEVLAATLAIAARHSLAIALLPTLSDIDRPEDLPLWDQRDQTVGAASSSKSRHQALGFMNETQ